MRNAKGRLCAGSACGRSSALRVCSEPNDALMDTGPNDLDPLVAARWRMLPHCCRHAYYTTGCEACKFASDGQIP